MGKLTLTIPFDLRLSSTDGLPEHRHVRNQAIHAFLKKEGQNLIFITTLIELEGLRITRRRCRA